MAVRAEPAGHRLLPRVLAELFVIVIGYLVSEVTRETGRNPGRVGSGCSTGLLVRRLLMEALWAEVSLGKMG